MQEKKKKERNIQNQTRQEEICNTIDHLCVTTHSHLYVDTIKTPTISGKHLFFSIDLKCKNKILFTQNQKALTSSQHKAHAILMVKRRKQKTAT